MAGIYPFDLPTTGAIAFADYFADGTESYAAQIADATQARANLRAALKESRHTDGDKDYLRLVKTIEEYLPHLYAITAAVASGALVQTKEPVFSWRTTLSAHLFRDAPRLDVPGLASERAFALLTLASALCRLAHTHVAALGAYERARGVSDAQRRAKDEQLGHAVAQLCRAAGLFEHVGGAVLPPMRTRPPELSKELPAALAKLALAAAQALAIRKLQTKSAAESAIAPGPPLPASHPSPALLAKLHLDASALCGAASALLGAGIAEPLRTHARTGAALHAALAHAWLGADAGAHDAPGAAVGWLGWAARELGALREGGGEAVAAEAERTAQFLRYYKRMNDTLAFQPVPAQAELQAAVPAGRLAVALRAFAPPAPAFGPGSVAYARAHGEDPAGAADGEAEGRPSYAGAGSYF
ncbi:hypothetical protein BC834DRAFT_1040810 [Gloeopeniophorella convolvens]|nr:hypothetical protein BC834DRAFT_1040810 [Gloeopeniophorella convolvens]